MPDRFRITIKAHCSIARIIQLLAVNINQFPLIFRKFRRIVAIINRRTSCSCDHIGNGFGVGLAVLGHREANTIGTGTSKDNFGIADIGICRYTQGLV